MEADEGGLEKFLTPVEVDALLPSVENMLQELDSRMARHRELSEMLEDMEAYWGEDIRDPANPEHEKHLLLHAQLQEAMSAANESVRRIRELGGHVKSYEQGLVDFYSIRDGRPVFLCWRRGEERIKYYHEVGAGFSGRKPMKP
ncbi:MAG: DUF2203 domain-containing protein [Thermoplasmata archaeon]